MTKLTLTFDNGPTPGVTDGVLDVLAEREIKSTFFLVGEKMACSDRYALAARARDEGHWIGNHTMHHTLPLGEQCDGIAGRSEIEDAQRAIGSLAHPRRFFRPNGRGMVGAHLVSPMTLDYLSANRYTIVLWTVFVKDSKVPSGWVERAVSSLTGRDWHVLVLHDLPTGAMADLPRFLDEVTDLGVEIEQDFPADCVPLDRGRLTDAAGLILPADPR